LNLIVLVVFHQFLLPRPKSRSRTAPMHRSEDQVAGCIIGLVDLSQPTSENYNTVEMFRLTRDRRTVECLLLHKSHAGVYNRFEIARLSSYLTVGSLLCTGSAGDQWTDVGCR